MSAYTRQQVQELVKLAIEPRLNSHGYIDAPDLHDVLSDLVNDLEDQNEPAVDAEFGEPGE